tara:strand:+ start:109581 stop:110408 length:828 start_codon:yes stop_codon:yes gene_type:complete
MIKTLLTLSLFWVISFSFAQNLTKDPEAEERFRTQTKQINQFFRRFNGEEDENGNRYYQGDKNFRDFKLRQDYLSILFDNQNSSLSSDTKKEFIRFVTDKKEPKYLDFHKGEWFAEVNAGFLYKGKQESVTLYLNIQPQGLGYEWVIHDVSYRRFKNIFNKDTTASKAFIHPMSHELDFMNLRKAFEPGKAPESYTIHEFEPDYLTLFLYELKQGNLKFETVYDLRFHFFQIDGWYFELSDFNRPGYNTGWLISNMVPINEKQKQALKRYIYGKM